MSIKLPFPHPDPITGRWTDDAIARNFEFIAENLVPVRAGGAAGNVTKLVSGAAQPVQAIYTNQLVPAGTIVMMRSGSTCPPGFTKVTTGIAGRYIRLTTGTAGTTGGSSSAVVGDGGHTHGVGTYANATAGAHTHNVDPPATNSGAPSSTVVVQSGTGVTVATSTHIHSTNITTVVSSSTGAHTHTLSGSSASNTTGITVTITPPFLEFILCEKT